VSGEQIFGGGSSAPHSLVKTAVGAGRRCVGLTAYSAVAVGDWKQFAKLVSSSSLLAEARVARLTVMNARRPPADDHRVQFGHSSGQRSWTTVTRTRDQVYRY